MRIRRSGSICAVFCFTLMLTTWITSTAQAPAKADQPAWKPDSPAVHAEDYAGEAACATCHQKKFHSQSVSEMARSVLRSSENSIFAGHPTMSFTHGKYTYTLRKQGEKLLFTASDGKDTITEPVFVAVGSGATFQAYLIQHDGQWHRAPVDFFADKGELGADPDAGAEMPVRLDDALGRSLTPDGVRGCFRCHSPATVIGTSFDISSRTPGIGCETCHGPGAKHVATMHAGKMLEKAIFNPAHLDQTAQSQFCNQCHVSAAKMKQQHPRGTSSVASEDYRLQSSRCWNATDKRIACTTCHDPHAPLEQKTAAYDAKCLACHAAQSTTASANLPGKACPKATGDCASCHMPRVAVPNSAILYADHRIRISREGEPFPE